jgi:hypothetical protein
MTTGDLLVVIRLYLAESGGRPSVTGDLPLESRSRWGKGAARRGRVGRERWDVWDFASRHSASSRERATRLRGRSLSETPNGTAGTYGPSHKKWNIDVG